MGMFCYQCQETAKNTGCTIKGVCGKTEECSNLQDLLIYVCKGVSFVALEAEKNSIDTIEEGRFIVNSLFMTITNANFDDEMFIEAIRTGLGFRDDLKEKIKREFTHDAVQWQGSTITEFKEKDKYIGVLSTDSDVDLRGMKQFVINGLKGISAYAEHAYNLGKEDKSIYTFIEEALVMTTQYQDFDNMIEWSLKTGEYGVKAMELLDSANTSKYGNPEASKADIGVGEKPGIIVTGHDLRDLEELLIQSEGKGIDIYTHSEMLPAHGYPHLKKFKHLRGNYGGAWYQQVTDFETFNGPALFTTNCLVPPRKRSSYNHRMFTTGATGMPEWKHIDKRLGNGQKDFSEIIEMAKTCKPPTEIETGNLDVGYAHNQVLQVADKILDAINSGALKKMVLMSGCDGRHKTRDYYTKFAEELPKDTIILTSGCAKFRYNKLNLGDIGGIPRVLDAGQCNDSYSWIVVASKLKEVLGLDDLNDLPIVYNIAWYEQKATIIHLALIYLGIKNIRIGPTLPGFFTPKMALLIKDRLGLNTITDVENDMAIFNIER